MFTIEFDHDNIEIVVIDDTGNHEDLKIDAFDDVVYFRQYNEDLDRYETIMISPNMWEELLASIQKSEGAFIKR